MLRDLITYQPTATSFHGSLKAVSHGKLWRADQSCCCCFSRIFLYISYIILRSIQHSQVVGLLKWRSVSFLSPHPACYHPIGSGNAKTAARGGPLLRFWNTGIHTPGPKRGGSRVSLFTLTRLAVGFGR